MKKNLTREQAADIKARTAEINKLASDLASTYMPYMSVRSRFFRQLHKAMKALNLLMVIGSNIDFDREAGIDVPVDLKQ